MRSDSDKPYLLLKTADGRMFRLYGVIFDVEGTIVNVEMAHWKAWAKIIKDHADHDFHLFRSDGSVNPKSLERIQQFVEHIVGGGGTRVPDEIEQLERDQEMEIIVPSAEIRRQKDVYYRLFLETINIKMSPGYLEFYSFLKEKGIPMRLGTTTHPEDLAVLLENSGLGQLFNPSEIVTPGIKNQFGQVIREKPEPDIFNFAAYDMGFSDTEHELVLVIGDSTGSDGAAAKAGGFTFLGMPTVYNEGVAEKFEKAGAIFTARDWGKLADVCPEYKEWLAGRSAEGVYQTPEQSP